MHYGFYTDLEELQEEFEEAYWTFLENEVSCNGLTPYDYLHGFCLEFALHLNQLYGYPVEAVYSKNSSLIHAYCVSEKDGKTIFIDIRGWTDDWQEFIQEFDFDIGCYDDWKYPLPKTERIIPETVLDSDNEALIVAKAIAYENKDFYEI